MRTSAKTASSLFISIIFGTLFVSSVFAQKTPVKAQSKLTEAKMKVCQGLENGITQRMNRLDAFFANMINKFDSIAMRVENYYTSKALPAGKTVQNYNSLVADIASKKALAQTALQQAKDDGAAFSCSVDSPRNKLVQYRTDMQNVKTALKNYRTSIKNLIVAVRSVTREENKLSPKPTGSK